ncbi:hypothetical protein LOAG_10198 [Loa loa]|uniref:Uncharacterized protein n=1 Tax=Loa loa TaxID=7209 RepID=A0A1S0TQD4_LOALO|nr:hypothetical protein LOAG_10198 [Loa loa]EFO18294.1 hypothetical protein LOAG_10198 [Loa loa]
MIGIKYHITLSSNLLVICYLKAQKCVVTSLLSANIINIAMGVFRVTIYGIMAGVFLYALGYDILYMPRVGHTWWIYKLVMLTMSNLEFYKFFSFLNKEWEKFLKKLCSNTKRL